MERRKAEAYFMLWNIKGQNGLRDGGKNERKDKGDDWTDGYNSFSNICNGYIRRTYRKP